jgi:hypothetical protein
VGICLFDQSWKHPTPLKLRLQSEAAHLYVARPSLGDGRREFTVIAEVLVFLRKHLDDHLRIAVGGSPDDPISDRVVFIDGEQMDPLNFKLGAVTQLLINVEEERILRPADLYARRSAEGHPQRGMPDLRLTLYLLFVARFKQYDTAWQHLSKIIEHFQSVRLFEAETTPELPAGVEKLVLELVTLRFAEQNEIWGALRTTHHPSVLYRVKLLRLRDAQISDSPEIGEIENNLRRIE